MNYLYRQEGESGTATALMVLYFLFFLLTVGTYIRLFVTVQSDPAFVPFTAEREDGGKKSRSRRTRGRGRDVEAQPWVPPDQNPDSPGLEAFYSKSVFICEADGRPKWCSECKQWKPDRAHHSSELDRCVRKMDHLCPWVGGMVSETCEFEEAQQDRWNTMLTQVAFNFFIQFTFYCTFYCVVCLATAAYCLSKQQKQGRSLDGRIVAIIALAGFFSFFTFGMTLTSGRFLFTNTTNIDLLKRSHVYQLAIRIPRNSPSTSSYPTISYPLESNPWWNSESGAPNPALVRDQQATTTFAIVRTKEDENPWDLGYWENFKAVMGNNIVEWLLPIARSPCCSHDSMESDYPFGPLIAELKTRYSLPEDVEKRENGIEMHHTRANGR